MTPEEEIAALRAHAAAAGVSLLPDANGDTTAEQDGYLRLIAEAQARINHAAALQSELAALQIAVELDISTAPLWDALVAYPSGSVILYDGQVYVTDADVDVGTPPSP